MGQSQFRDMIREKGIIPTQTHHNSGLMKVIFSR
jgi:hypothetical protein